MNGQTYVETGALRSPPALFRRVSWGAIFAGLLVALVTHLALTLLGVAIGAATINPTQEQSPAQGLAIGSAIWVIVSMLVSMFAGAYVAGRLCGGPRRADGMLHGVVTWSAATIATIFLLASAVGSLLSGMSGLLGGVMKQGGQTQGQGSGPIAAATEQFKQAFPEAGALLPPTGRQQDATPAGQLTGLAQQDPELAIALARMERASTGPEPAPAERDAVVQILSTKHGIQPQQAQAMVGQWHQQYQQTRAQAEQSARQAGDAAASGVAKGAMWAFIALILSGAIAAWGGWVGSASLPGRWEDRHEPAPA